MIIVTWEIDVYVQVGVSWVFYGYFTSISRVLQVYFMSISRRTEMYPHWAKMMFLDAFVKKGLLLCTEVITATNANSIGQKHPKNSLWHTHYILKNHIKILLK